MDNKKNDIVIPGQEVDVNPKDDFAYAKNGKTYSTVLGLARGRIIPMKGPYQPRFGDWVIGIISQVRFSGYSATVYGHYEGSISARDVRDTFEIGDIVFGKINKVDEVGNIDLDRVKKLHKGRLLTVSPVKVPRIIGKNDSMLEIIKKATGCTLFVGKNGTIWISTEGKTALAMKTIQKIVKEAHVPGLTSRISEYLAGE